MAEILSNYHSREPTSINSLSTEIISHILEELQDVSPQAIITVRRVCRAFNELATPLKYETVRINQKITDVKAAILYPRALANIHAHTRHIVLQSGLDRQCVGALLNNIQKLRSVRYMCFPLLSERPGRTAPDLRWSFISNTGPTYTRWVPSDINALAAHDPSKIKVHIEGLPVGALDGKLADLHRSVMPFHNLVSLETTILQTTAIFNEEPHLPALKHLLLNSRSLEIFRYRDSGKPTQFCFRQGERLPAFTELTLQLYDWTHGTEEAALHWDFSRIQSLELVSVPVYNFFSSVAYCLGDFANLHTLRVDDSVDQQHHRGDGGREKSQRAAASAIIYRLVMDHIRALHTLQLTCDFASFPINALLRHAGTLRELVFRDHGVFSGHDDLPPPTLSLDSLSCLARTMKRLESLQLDINIYETSSAGHMIQLGKFPQLKTLTLHIPTAVGGSPSQTAPWYTHSPDPDKACAQSIFDMLRNNKTGPAAWESITIKVEGWQGGPVGAGRSSPRGPSHRRAGEGNGDDALKAEIWKLLASKRGVFAKRCFVMERGTTTREAGRGGQGGGEQGGGGQGGGGGGYVIREPELLETKLGRQEQTRPG